MLHYKGFIRPTLALLSLAFTAGAAQAQTATTSTMDDQARSARPPVLMDQADMANTMGGGYSLLPFTRRGYVGIQAGRTQLDTPCGSGGYDCNNPDGVARVFTGGLVNDWLGAEVGYFRTGRADRAGGNTRAQGFDVVGVLRAPIGAFNAYVKGGAVYGETRVSAGPLSDVGTGKKRGWGPSYGVGVGYDFLPNSGVVLDWTRNELRFAGLGGRQDVDTTSLGYVYRF